MSNPHSPSHIKNQAIKTKKVTTTFLLHPESEAGRQNILNHYQFGKTTMYIKITLKAAYYPLTLQITLLLEMVFGNG